MTGTPVDEVAEWDSETLENLDSMDLTPSRLTCAETRTRGRPKRSQGPLTVTYGLFTNYESTLQDRQALSTLLFDPSLRAP